MEPGFIFFEALCFVILSSMQKMVLMAGFAPALTTLSTSRLCCWAT